MLLLCGSNGGHHNDVGVDDALLSEDFSFGVHITGGVNSGVVVYVLVSFFVKVMVMVLVFGKIDHTVRVSPGVSEVHLEEVL